MLPNDLKQEFKKRGPWVTQFAIAGQNYGGSFDVFQDPRIDWFFQQFPHACTILELGSLEGGHTIRLAERPGVERVVGIEGRQQNVHRASFIKQIYRAENVTFIQANLEETDLSVFGEFDAVFCAGLLYHLPNPWDLIGQIARVTTNLFLWTHYAKVSRAHISLKGLKGRMFRESGPKDVLSGLSPKSFWPTLDSLTEMLERYCFRISGYVENLPDHPDGPAITLTARRQL